MSGTTDEYTGSVLAPSLAIPFAGIISVFIGIVGAYYSNKYCSKNKLSDINKDYMTAGEKHIDKREWALIEMAML